MLNVIVHQVTWTQRVPPSDLVKTKGVAIALCSTYQGSYGECGNLPMGTSRSPHVARRGVVGPRGAARRCARAGGRGRPARGCSIAASERPVERGGGGGTPGGPIARRSGDARLGRSARDPSDAFRGGGRSYPPRSGSRRTGCVHGLARTGGPPLMMQPNRSTAAADEHRSSDACHQAMIFGSGHRLSREAYDDLSGPHALSGVTFLYLPLLRSPVQPLDHFDAVLALAMVALRRSEFRPVVRSAVDQWASRATDAWGLRSELANSVALLLDDPHAASVWALEWCRRVLSRTGATNAAALPEQASGLGMSEDDLLILAGLNDAGDCAVAVEDLFPAVLLLSQVVGRTAREFYAPQALIPALTKPWTVEVGVDVLRRSIPHVGVSGSTSLN